MKLNEVRYYYYGRTFDTPCNRVITVASKLSTGEDGTLILNLGITFLNPEDKFVKAEGRAIALERLENPETAFYIPFTGNSNKDIINYLESIRELMPYRYRNMVFNNGYNSSGLGKAFQTMIEEERRAIVGF